jgi:nickel-dependent lactate racemase
MRVLLNYGRAGLPLDLPDDWDVTVVRKRPMPVLPEPAAAVRAALNAPVGSAPLAREAQGKRTACILICDITRPVPNAIILPALVRSLMEAGMAPRDIQILVATGLHRPNEGEELRELVGDPWVMETVPVANHFARNEADHVAVGTTSRGTAVQLDRRFVQAELRIATGLVEPHFMAGYSGGRKVVTPGVAHEKTITHLHTARYFEHPRSANCVLDGNPLHEEQMEVVRMLGRILAVNAVIDEHRNLSFINFGEVEASHLQAAAFMDRYAVVPVERRFKTVITSSAGYPLDKTYYQTVKGMVGPMEILAPGGDLFIVSEISEGFGSAEYRQAQRRLIELGADGFLQEILPKEHAAIDEWQTEMQLKPMRIGTIHLYTQALSEEERAITGVNIVPDLEAAVRESVSRSGDTRVAVVPEGPYVVPRYVARSLS